MPSSIRLELTTSVHDDRPVFATGNFSDWLPDIDRFKLQPIGPGQYVLDFPDDFPLPDHLEYKYTRGGWDHVELAESGDAVPNRFVAADAGPVQDYVPH